MHSIYVMNEKRKSNEVFIKNNYETEEKEVLLTLDIETKQHYVKKISKDNQRKVYQELQVLQFLQKINGIPEVRNSGRSQNQNFFYTNDFYDLSLSDILSLKKTQKKKFSQFRYNFILIIKIQLIKSSLFIIMNPIQLINSFTSKSKNKV